MRIVITVATIFGSLTANAATFKYECSPQSGIATEQTITVDGENLSVTTSDKMNGMTFKASYDEGYKPKNGSRKVRYLGRSKAKGLAVILYSGMLEGARMGYVQIRGHEDGFWSADYRCVRK